jgi:hypothetical protein
MSVEIKKLQGDKMKYLILLASALMLMTGCANMDYAKNLKSEELLYDAVNFENGKSKFKKTSIDGGYENIGSDKFGYIGTDNSDSRKELDYIYPVIPHDKQALEAISESHNHRMRLGQVLVFSADIDRRASGFLKDNTGKSISISGRFENDANAAITQGLASGVVVGAASGVMAVSSMNNQLASSGLKLSEAGTNAVGGGQMAQGLIAGLIAGAIHAAVAEQSFKEIIAAKNFGEMMQGTTLTAAHLLPNLEALGPDGQVRNSAPVVIGPGRVKRYFLKFTQKTIDYRNEYCLITVLGSYRGKKYQESYPNTLGWEYYITNMSLIYLNSDEISNPEKRFIGIRREVRAKNLM